ncbi:MAG: SPOR domain-containing protein [Bacteroidales bacterium]|nr:SPOR domain-containing protein [Bacteroidales bacterium]
MNNDNNNNTPFDVNNGSDNSNLPANKKYTIQIFALKNQKPVDFFSDLVGVKMHVSDDGWYRYYVGEFNSYDEAKVAVGNLKELGYNPFIRKLSFFQK